MPARWTNVGKSMPSAPSAPVQRRGHTGGRHRGADHVDSMSAFSFYSVQNYRYIAQMTEPNRSLVYIRGSSIRTACPDPGS